ncbi:unnamed protein product [Prunus armeniaca]|uniref:Uncharacterized protein n=1 Tax=Prunus armeniaca TaxID=36596 RepID=A0A6J5VBK6_PRUAR|nr:unnamed protein product [Prunus armeniaca]
MCGRAQSLGCFQLGFCRFIGTVGGNLQWVMATIDDIVSRISSSLTISEAEAVEVVGVEELRGLKAYRFFLVGRLLTVKDFHEKALIGTMKAIWYT